MIEEVIQEGYIIQYNGTDKTYYEIDDLGDWTLGGTIQSAAVFTDESELQDALETIESYDAGKIKVLKIKSTFRAELSEANEINPSNS